MTQPLPEDSEIMDERIALRVSLDPEGTSFASQLRRSIQAALRTSQIRRSSSRLASENISIVVNELIEDPDVDAISKKWEDETNPQMNVEPFVLDPVFESKFAPEEMRCLALVAHNHMKPAMKDFVAHHLNLLKKFRLTGTATTMKMLREVLGEEHMNQFGGPECKSGPLGGDAELVAQMCADTTGAIFFFQDPMDSHPHSADIECLNRQTNVHNLMVCQTQQVLTR
jgi:methylglyoxal synthase